MRVKVKFTNKETGTVDEQILDLSEAELLELAAAGANLKPAILEQLTKKRGTNN